MPKFNSNDNTWRDLDSMLNGALQSARKNDWTATSESDASGVRTVTVVISPRLERDDGTASEGVHGDGED